MAIFRADGLTELGLSLQEIANLPEDVVFEMLEAEAAVVVNAHKQEVPILTNQLHNSIDFKRIKSGDKKPRVDVYPTGKRDDGVRNAEVGFILEYGAPNRGLEPTQWMRTANEGCADEAIEAATQVFYNYLASKNL